MFPVENTVDRVDAINLLGRLVLVELLAISVSRKAVVAVSERTLWALALEVAPDRLPDRVSPYVKAEEVFWYMAKQDAVVRDADGTCVITKMGAQLASYFLAVGVSDLFPKKGKRR